MTTQDLKAIEILSIIATVALLEEHSTKKLY